MGELANRMSVFDSLQPEQDRRNDLPERTIADVLALPEDLRTSMDYLIEQGESELAEVAAHIGQDETSTRALLTDLIEKGFVQTEKGTHPTLFSSRAHVLHPQGTRQPFAPEFLASQMQKPTDHV